MSDMTVAELAEDREACGELARLFWAGAHVGPKGMQEAVRGLVASLAPAPDGLHVAPDGNDDLTLWDGPDVVARECDVTPTAWRLLTEAATPPNAADAQADADDDRPLAVGDRVRVDDDATRVSGEATPGLLALRGKCATVKRLTSRWSAENASVSDGSMTVYVAPRFLTYIGADA